ncbi:13655_t:CDS:2, partial [Funneliformis mosseae]
QVTTKLIEDQHYLQHASDHNHATEATDTSQEVYPYLSSYNALHQSIRKIRNKDLPAVSKSLRDLVIPENLKKTLNGSDFLVKDSIVNNNRILLFTTIAN